MSKDRTKKEKNIDDVLLSIDSLLDTASDVEPSINLEESAQAKTSRAKKSDPEDNPVAKKPAKPKAKPVVKTPAKSKGNPVKKSPAKSKPVDNRTTTSESGTVSKKADAPKIITAEQSNSEELKKVEQNVLKTQVNQEASANTASVSKSTEDQDTEHPHRLSADNDEADGHLNFTTVDDDISPNMRELPILDDIVSAEDLALIGSGKEPPKKILTKAFRKKSTTDKIIDILENHLSDYKVTKLEYKYLHELIEELLEAESKNN